MEPWSHLNQRPSSKYAVNQCPSSKYAVILKTQEQEDKDFIARRFVVALAPWPSHKVMKHKSQNLLIHYHSAPRTAGELLSCVAGGWGWRLTDEGRGLDPQALELRLAAAEALAVRQEALAHRHRVRLGRRATACLSHQQSLRGSK